MPLAGAAAHRQAVDADTVTGFGSYVPVLASDGKERVALRWVAAEPGAFQFPFLDINRARNWQEFIGAIRQFTGPQQNMVYADVEGNVAYYAPGLRSGMIVARGTTIAFEGSTGWSTGPHLHFEIRVNNVYKDPCIWLGC